MSKRENANAFIMMAKGVELVIYSQDCYVQAVPHILTVIQLFQPIVQHIHGFPCSKRVAIAQFTFLDLPPISLSMHSSSNLAKSGNVAACNQAGKLALSWLNVLFCRVQPVLKTCLHDSFQLVVHFFRRPRNALAILGHFKT